MISLCSHLPHPAEDVDQWYSFIEKDQQRWSHVTSMLHYSSSALDDRTSDQAGKPKTHQCPECEACLADEKAMDQHRRRKHGVRQMQRFYANGDGICPVCKARLCTRLRLLSHLSDKRRPKCWNVIRSAPAQHKLADALVEKLDESDRVERLNARRQGRSHAVAKGQSFAANGKMTGRVRA